jgi:hypothetical protein
MKPGAATWIGKLDGGQLDMMWTFLRFHGEKPTVREIEGLEASLDSLRTMMIQKGDGSREGKTAGAELFADMETVLNSIIIETMWLYLSGGLTMLKEVLGNEQD